jgi:multicomponent Na+:H+ antiporter subunit B
MKDQHILRVATKIMFPFILIFGLYVIFHGDLSPGGGFQGGCLIAAAFILYGLVYDRPAMQKILPRGVSDALLCVGVLLYIAVGTFSLLSGYRFLDHAAIVPSDPGAGEPWGMSLVEYGVGITVSMVMITLYNELSEFGETKA